MRRVPMHRALVRPPTLLGCDRSLLFGLGLLSMALILPAGISVGNPWMVVLGAAVFSVGMVLLAVMGAHDPQMFDVYRRALLYRERYSARARWDAPEPRLRRHA